MTSAYRSVADQYQAAAKDMARLTDAYAASGAAREGIAGPVVIAAAETALLTWLLGKADTCPHNPHYKRPQPVFAAMCMPDLVVCAECLDLLVPSGPEGALCDLCRREVTLQGDDLMNNGVAWFGAFGFCVGVCAECVTWCGETNPIDHAARKPPQS